MSAEIWTKIQSTIKEIRPDLLAEFNHCRTRVTVCAFLTKHFPLPLPTSWDVQLMSKVPDMLRSMAK